MKNQPPPKAGIRLVLILSAFPSLAALPVEPRWREQCTVPEMTLQEMMIIRRMNCAEVENAILAFQSRESPCHGGEKLWTTDCLRNLTRRGAPPQSEWEQRSRAALQLCEKSWTAFSNGTTGDLRQAAQFAVDAWGGVLMRGHDCCVLLAAPYCYAQTIDIFDFSIPLLVLLFVMLFICVSSKSCALWLRQMGKKAPEEPYHCTESLTGMPQNALDLEQKLMAIWGTSCLGGKGDYHKALPKSQEWGRAAASFYATMKLDFGFQADSVCNQFEHLISLWRSHAAMVTDLAIQDAYENRWRWSSGSWSDQTEPVRMDVNGNKALQRAAAEAEPELLKDALADLHRDLLEGLHRWRARLAACPALQVPSRRERQRRGLLAHADSESGKQLVEISVYLLVWGEAGNIRFMPEVVCFLTELALASEDVQMGGSLYQGSGTTKSGLFLAKIIRPIYNVIFEEWYLRVDVDAKTGKDKKVLRDKFHRFLPADTANYDDWNELFCDPIRMSDQLRLEDGTRLFDLPHEHRFAALHRVNWRRALAANMVKTHREVHSLWGVFASIHRVILLHAVLFLALLLIAVENELPTMTSAVIGSKRSVRFAILGLIVPPYGFALLYARWEVTGAARRIQSCSAREICRLLYHTAWSLMWCVPAITYTIIRVFEHEQEQTEVQRNLFPILVIHYVVTAIGIGIGLFYPIWDSDAIWPLTRVSVLTQFSRFVFWGMVLSVKCVLAYFGLISKMLRSVSKLQLSQYSSSHVFAQAGWRGLLLNAPLSRDFVEECGIWGAAFFLFFADTLLWHILGCTILGVCYVFVQRRGRIRAFVCEDSVSKIQQRFPAKVLPFALQGPGGIPITFYSVWDRIVEFLRYEGKVTSREIGDLSYCAEASSNVQWKQLNMPLPGIDQGKREFRRPQLFRGTRMAENLLRKYTSQGQHGWPHNREAKWRLQALARGLGLPLPMPYRAPYVPGLSVLIPHYGESILAEKQLELLREPPHQEFYSIPLMDWLADKYKDEFDNFSEKMTSTQYVRGMTWPKAGTDWGKYNDENWEKLSYWASMRLQTLFRTVSGMMLYHNALQCHFEAQGDRRNKLGVIWDPSDAFTCVVAMQMYTFFNSMQYKHTNIMFKKFPKSMKVAYIDCEDLEDSAHPDCIHEDQKRRYYSCLIDASCPEDATGRREPKYKIEIPGYPILGDGKGDNQNTAVPFTRGTYVQCIDANQGAYFEQMLLLPNVLGEFRSKRPGDGGSKKIIGFPEHITSDFGSVGDFAASSELAFGTISQRSYSLLGARMHYGHPDIMNKEKYASHDLQIIAPTVRELLSAFSISFDVVNQLLAVQKAQGSSAMDVACSWVQRNRDIWEKWLPDTTACFPQFGLFDKVTEIFKDDREGDTSNLICKACGSGSFSASLRDGKGLTYVCRPCAPGYAQPSGASTACEPCPVGEYQEEPRASSCKRCAFGQYQNATGQSQCRKCPAERTTLGLGSESLAECVCKAGSIEEDGQCVPCGIGLSCPVASTVAGLTAHLPASSADFDRPFIEHGYNSDADAPLTIYRCREHCPGGAPGTCSAGRIGVTCAECPAGSFAWGDGTCSACAEGNISLWMISGGVVLLLCVFPAYARLTGPYSPKIGATGVAWSLLGLTVEIAQNLQVVSTAPTSWPPLMVRITSSVSGLSSSLSGLGGFACIGHAGVVMMYAGQVLIFPAVIGIVLLTFGLTKLFPFVRQACSCAGATRMMACCGRLARICRIPLLPERAYTWTWYGTACLTGKFCQLTFPTMANVGLSPMMCYSHPGGQKYSLMKYSNTFCGTSDQVVMVWAGAGLLTLTFSFLALCIWIGLRAPALSVQGQGAAKFLFADFRPDVSWFGLVMLARGLLLSLPSVVVPDSPNVQLVLMHSVILVSMVFRAYFQPWKSSALNLVDTISQSLLLTLLGIGLGGLGHSESAVRILHLLGAVFCIALLVALGLAFVVLTLAIAVDKIWGYYALGQQIASLGAAPDSAFLVYLLQELTGSMQKKALQRESLVAAMDQFGTHDARMILMSLTILEMELGLSAPSESLDPARDAAFPVARVGSSTIAKRRASCETVVQRSRRSSTHNESISLAEEYMMQQGGVSKATKTLNLSEDIFAGMDFVLRGGGRTIKHREYFHLAKGRDLGFNTVLAFFSKLSSGAGEQLITRQTNRLGNLLPLPEFLSFYYAHMGHYLSQWSISWGLPLLTLIWLVVLLNGCEESNDLSIKCIIGSQSAASVMAEAWQYIYSGQLLILFLLAQMAPIFFEVWMEAGLVQSTVRLVKQILTLSPVMFIFQAKVIGFYTMNELKFGGATYVATGRGLPTERRPFLGVIGEQGELIPGGLYLDYARLTYYDGASLLFLMILVLVAGGTENTGPQLVGILVSLCLVTVSWLLAPFIFNPYQFRPSCWINDIKAWTRFFLEDGGMHWKKWFTANQLKPRRGFRATVLQIGFMMELWFVVTCFASLNARTAVVCQVSDTWRLYYWNLLSPPIFAPALLCILLGCCGALGNLCSERRSTSAPKFDETYSALGTPKEEETRSRCPQQCPLVLVSLLVALLTIAELAAPLVWVASLGWKKASMLALLLKIFWLRLSMGLAMTAIRSSCFERLGCLGRPLELWLDALCMFRDIVVSSIIFLALCPLVLFSGISEFICPTFSIHHLIIYRQPGHTDRENLDFDPILARMCFDEYETEEDTDDSDLSTPHD